MRYIPQGCPPCMNMPQGFNGYSYPMGRPTIMTCPYGTIKYKIMLGDTLYSIAINYGTTVQEIMKYNPQISDPNAIFAGDYLCIPYPMMCDGFMYTIKPGDTLYAIATSFAITVEEILQANPHISPNYYQAGEIICIPQASPCQGMTTMYVIKEDDTLTSILSECNLSLNALLASNPSFDPMNIMPGIQLCIIPTPCAPMCDEQHICIVPKGCNSLEDLAKEIGKTPEAILLKNPNYPPCYFVCGHPYCMP